MNHQMPSSRQKHHGLIPLGFPPLFLGEGNLYVKNKFMPGMWLVSLNGFIIYLYHQGFMTVNVILL